MKTTSWTHPFAALAVVLAAGLVGCTETVSEVPVSSAYIEVGPPIEHVRVAPEILYEGHRVYWYGSHWYFRTGDGHWGYYAREPYMLRGHRYVVRY